MWVEEGMSEGFAPLSTVVIGGILLAIMAAARERFGNCRKKEDKERFGMSKVRMNIVVVISDTLGCK